MVTANLGGLRAKLRRRMDNTARGVRLKADAGFVTPEDLQAGPINRNPRPEQLELNDYVDRSRRMQRNDLENIPATLACGLLFCRRWALIPVGEHSYVQFCRRPPSPYARLFDQTAPRSSSNTVHNQFNGGHHHGVTRIGSRYFLIMVNLGRGRHRQLHADVYCKENVGLWSAVPRPRYAPACRIETAVQIKGKEKIRDAVHHPERERERDWYISRALAFIILLNGFAALLLVAALAFVPQSTTDPHRLAWAMMVFGSGAIAGLLSSLLAYFGRALVGEIPSRVIIRDLLRVGAIVAAIGSGAAFLRGRGRPAGVRRRRSVRGVETMGPRSC